MCSAFFTFSGSCTEAWAEIKQLFWVVPQPLSPCPFLKKVSASRLRREVAGLRQLHCWRLQKGLPLNEELSLCLSAVVTLGLDSTLTPFALGLVQQPRVAIC